MTTMPSSTSAAPPSAIDGESAWRAVEARDARFDDHFVYAVRSTRIYCRPSCPSRRPHRENVRFFALPDEAERAGYRACQRCRPQHGAVTAAADAVARAAAYLDGHVHERVTLDVLAGIAGMSSYHLQRTFKRIIGVSPREYHDALRLSRLKTRLRAGDTVSRATYEAGFGSSSRVYERSDRALGMTPAAYRRGGAGMRIAYTTARSRFGRVLVGVTGRGVCAVLLGDDDESLVDALRADFPRAELAAGTGDHQAWVDDVVRHVSAGEAPLTVPLDVQGTDFQQQVWRALREIPAGETRSYAEVAAVLGRPGAARAVATACANNHLAVVIPCHRVVRGDGALSGYKWGVPRKRALIDAERSAKKRAG